MLTVPLTSNGPAEWIDAPAARWGRRRRARGDTHLRHHDRRTVHARDQPFEDRHRVFFVDDVGAHDDEGVVTDAGDRVTRADGRAERRGCRRARPATSRGRSRQRGRAGCRRRRRTDGCARSGRARHRDDPAAGRASERWSADRRAPGSAPRRHPAIGRQLERRSSTLVSGARILHAGLSAPLPGA